jgi:two-component system, NtrC family, response regulator
LSSRCPPLRERGDDIVLVAKAFLHNYGVEHVKPGLTFAPDALRALILHRWPGNVRELQNRVRRALIMADGKRVTARDLELADALSDLPPQTLKEARESVEREMIQDALRRHRGKITSAALELGISRPTLYELMEKLGIGRE